MNTHLSAEKLNSLDIIETVKNGADLFQKNPKKIIILSLIAILVSTFSLGILSGMMFLNMVGIIKRLDNSVDGTYDPEISELFSHMDRFVDTFVLSAILFGLLIALFIVLFILQVGIGLIGSIIGYSLIVPVWLISFNILNEEEGGNSFDIFMGVINFIKSCPIKCLGLGAVLGLALALPSILGSLLSFIIGIATYGLIICTGRVFFKAITQ
jgi:hypothetical protein